ncbi:1,4-alpha-glucan branching protein GlgB [Streptococcus sp. DD13]|uniref:1,4-alpha-glucan branching protein GlgB n=1 Tax=Streptococcus sp. DD13 TaxID=1777881 RepID=UPI00079A8EEC|nr:1,4-alpha-glucan branching protein GlgB [Streptococcus sp. DD13]KXT78975.1 1,4-alpha-glucan (glycogen) branching enzyme, GH-13-type [Streptococcus sp. DD13]
MSTFGELDHYYFQSGEHTSLYEKMGAHPIFENQKRIGFHFRLYAPNAQAVYVVGDFNEWEKQHPMLTEGDGYFSLPILGVLEQTAYKYLLHTKDGQWLYKSDPFAFWSEIRPHTASLTYQSHYDFQDQDWINQRLETSYENQPLSIYEVHLGSWKQKHPKQQKDDPSTDHFYSYREIAPLLIDYVKSNGFTHIELMPIMEHPFDGSWGYQVTGYYSATSRYGEPDDLKYLIDQCHQAGIGVLLDWVPLHFCKDAHGLYLFDGSPLYEYPKESDRENHQWGTANFDLAKGTTRSFLLSNASYWLKEFHFDGIRVDALSYILYWRGETEEDKLNHGAIDFIKRVNALLHTEHKGILMIAEDSSSYPGVTHPLDQGGLGFDLKWDLGWMNDSLKFMSRSSIYRPFHSNELTFGMYYNQNEHFILPLSHDEVVHGKLSIVEKMNGDYEDQFHQARVYYSFMYAHPGKKLLFMGNEWGHIREWHEHREMDWMLLNYPVHQSFHQMMKTLLTLYRDHDAFWKYDFQAYEKGFDWVKIDPEANLYAFRRMSDDEEILIVNNFNDQELFDVELDLPDDGTYRLIFSSNAVPTATFNLQVTDGKTKLTIPRYTSFYFKKLPQETPATEIKKGSLSKHMH